MDDKNIQWLVITDLDGTLLNHHSYTFDAALNAITDLQKKNIPIILNTSKTYTETITIRQKLGLTDPFIVENGSCIYLPKDQFDKQVAATSRDNYWEIVMGASQETISDVLESIKVNEEHYIRLSQCTVQQAVTLTGLSEEQAPQAIAREFSEPLIWNADETALDAFLQQLASNALTTLQGGRFLHVIGDCDKGRASKRLIECYANTVKRNKIKTSKIKTVALGDSANDAAMLSVADVSVMVNSPSNHQLHKLISADIQTKAQAPEGWQEAINNVLIKNGLTDRLNSGVKNE